MVTYLLVALGGALGSLGRFWVAGVVAEHFGDQFPWGTLIINVSGSFLIGIFFGATGLEGRWLAQPSTRAFLMVGICGGYTTFSSFSLQTLNLLREGEWFRAGANCVASVVLCLVAVWAGYMLAMIFNSTKSS